MMIESINFQMIFLKKLKFKLILSFIKLVKIHVN